MLLFDCLLCRLTASLKLDRPHLRTLEIKGLPSQGSDYEIMDLEGLLKSLFVNFGIESSNIGTNNSLIPLLPLINEYSPYFLLRCYTIASVGA